MNLETFVFSSKTDSVSRVFPELCEGGRNQFAMESVLHSSVWRLRVATFSSAVFIAYLQSKNNVRSYIREDDNCTFRHKKPTEIHQKLVETCGRLPWHCEQFKSGRRRRNQHTKRRSFCMEEWAFVAVCLDRNWPLLDLWRVSGPNATSLQNQYSQHAEVCCSLGAPQPFWKTNG